MSLIIQTGDGESSFFEVKTTLEDVAYTLEIRWNVRDESWYMNILDADGALPILSGLRLVADWLMASYNVGYGGPPGAFALIDTSGRGEECDFSGLGSRWQLRYFTSDELSE